MSCVVLIVVLEILLLGVRWLGKYPYGIHLVHMSLVVQVAGVRGEIIHLPYTIISLLSQTQLDYL